jgi:choline transport protein
MSVQRDVSSSPDSSPASELHQRKGISHQFDIEDGDDAAYSGLPGHTSNDARDMGRMGKTQELRVRALELTKDFADPTIARLPAAICFGFHCHSAGNMGGSACVSELDSARASPLTFDRATTQGMVDGGIAGLFWSYVWTWLGFSTVMASLAEMASMAPTAGGQ